LGKLWNIIKTGHKSTWALSLGLTASLTALVLYLLDLNYGDNALLFLLAVLKYSSFVVCICSLYKLIINIYHTFRQPSFLRVMKVLLYLVFIIYSVFIIFVESFITVIAGGNG
jgi:hypothetical protein